MRWLRYVIGLLLALTLHSLLDSFFPNALAFFNPYVILVVYYSMGGNVLGAIEEVIVLQTRKIPHDVVRYTP